MSKIILLGSLLILVNGCSSKTTSINPKCKKIEQNMLDLEKEKRLNLTYKVVNTVVDGYPYGESSKNIEQRIKILKMKLDECKKE